MRVINDLAMSGFILTPYISCIRTKRSDVMMIVVTGPMVRIYIYMLTVVNGTCVLVWC